MGFVHLAVPPQRSGLPKKDLAIASTGEGGLGTAGCNQWGEPGSWTVATLVGDQGLGGEEGAGAGEADDEGLLQLLGHEDRWVLPLHVMLLEFGIGKVIRQ